ncbi:MAG: peptidoglycan-binding protein, partial [Acidobacteriota bacterium]|nr:peptidoglycan-binding protein [Acidobacteriota bacterium]
MWIWELQRSSRGNIAAIVAQAKRYGIGAVYVKSSDGTSYWPQFSRTLVASLHRAGLRVCAWQYVYGIRPVAEANLAYRAALAGANCLVIDAESQYQAKYPAAQTYIARLRKLLGRRFPVGLAGFPYVDYHLSFPYSVFLGPGGAQYNLPQMYWADIGTTVPFVFAHTYEYNEIYRRPIFPLGQLWGRLSASSIEQFDLLAKEYGATGVSWWDWQSAPLRYWADITRLPPQLVGYAVNRTPASVFRGNVGDLVIWAQEHLYGAGYQIAVDGQFGPRTQAAVRAFQRKHRLAATGVINGLTWDALVKVTPVTVRWTQRGRQTVAVVARGPRL